MSGKSRKSFIEKLTEHTAERTRVVSGHPMVTALALIKTTLVTYRRWVVVDVLERVRKHGPDRVEEDLRAEVFDDDLVVMMQEKVRLSMNGIDVEAEG